MQPGPEGTGIVQGVKEAVDPAKASGTVEAGQEGTEVVEPLRHLSTVHEGGSGGQKGDWRLVKLPQEGGMADNLVLRGKTTVRGAGQVDVEESGADGLEVEDETRDEVGKALRDLSKVHG